MNAFGIDLGTNNIKIYSYATDEIMVQKNMIAIEGKNTLFAYGDSAYEMYEKAPENITISYPLSFGVISDLDNMEKLIRYFISDLQNDTLKNADFIIAVPSNITDVEKRAFYDLLKEANVKAKKILVADKAVLAGLGMGLDVKSSQGMMMVDVGYHTTEISVISLGGIVISKKIKIGGLKFDETIKNAVRKEYNLFIGNKTSEVIKNSLTELEKEEKGAVVYGRDVISGLPVEREIPTDFVDKCLQENFDSIIENIKMTLERTPPELAADIYRNGIYMTGGASQVNHLVEKVANGTNLKVNITDDPIVTVAEGLGRVFREPGYQSITYSVKGMGK